MISDTLKERKTLEFFKTFFGSKINVSLVFENRRINPKNLSEKIKSMFEKGNHWFDLKCKKMFQSEYDFNEHFFLKHYEKLVPLNNSEFTTMSMILHREIYLDQMELLRSEIIKNGSLNSHDNKAIEEILLKNSEYRSVRDSFDLLGILLKEKPDEDLKKYRLPDDIMTVKWI